MTQEKLIPNNCMFILGTLQALGVAMNWLSDCYKIFAIVSVLMKICVKLRQNDEQSHS